MSYIPRPGSKTEAAIEFIKKNGGRARSKEIAVAVNSDTKNILTMLQAAVDGGTLMCCKVEVPGEPAQNEYRIAAGMPAPEFKNFRVKPGGGLASPAPSAAVPTTPGPTQQRSASEQLAAELIVSQAVPPRRARAMAKRPKLVESPLPAIQTAAPSRRRSATAPSSAAHFAVWSDGAVDVVAHPSAIRLRADEAERLYNMLGMIYGQP